MKRTYIILLLCVLTLSAVAQRPDLTKRTKTLSKELGISESRAGELARAMEHNRAALKWALRDTSLKGAAKQQRLRMLSHQQQEQLRMMLSPAEQEKWKQVMAARSKELEQKRKAADEKNRQSQQKKAGPKQN